MNDAFADIKHTFVDGKSVIEGYDLDGNIQARYVFQRELGANEDGKSGAKMGRFYIYLFF